MALDYRLGDTIVAPATAMGEAGVGILRLSGPRALAIARALCRRQKKKKKNEKKKKKQKKKKRKSGGVGKIGF
jgi:tRNA U34 5-carboxymethylaminomethyl modifying GTPase MnmE/TrmE